MTFPKLLIAASFVLATQAQAQSMAATGGTLVVVPAFGEVTHANDLATATFAVEEQDKDQAAAASRVNQKMKQGTDIVRQQDPQAVLKTQGYYSRAVYAERRALPDGTVPKPAITGWRVGQYLQVKTTNLFGLPKTTAAAQKVMSLNSLQFGLAPATVKKLDEQRIAATWQNLGERIASIAAVMGLKPADALIETVDFEGSGNYAQRVEVSGAALTRYAKADAAEVAEPSFEPGETTLPMRLVGKVKFR